MKQIDIFENIPLFFGLNDDERDILRKVAVKKTFPKNTILFSEGDRTDSLYLISSGKVKVTMNDEEGKEIVLSILGPHEYFGEMALMDGEPRSAYVVTRETTNVLIISRGDFRNVLSSNSNIAFNIIKGLLKRLREADKKIESLALNDVYGRIARLFVNFARPVDQKLVIEEKLTHQDIANMVGSSREMVSRILKELSIGDYITIDKKNITINKKLPYSW